MSSRRFEPPSTSKFVIFQGEHKGPKRIFLIWGAPKQYQTLFVIQVLIYSIIDQLCQLLIYYFVQVNTMVHILLFQMSTIFIIFGFKQPWLLCAPGGI